MTKKLRSLIDKLILLSLTIITFSSLVYLYDVRDKIFKNININNESKYSKDEIEQNLLDAKFANLVLKGDYILFFRHAHREKWIDVASYDSWELLQNLKGEEEYFKKAVCLSDMGIVQAKMMGEQFDKFNLPVSKVVSSPSCRSRQTAELTFGKIDEVNNVFMHYGPFNETRKKHAQLIKEELINLNVEPGTNIIITGHGNTIQKEVFDEIKYDVDNYSLEEGGFFVIKKDKKKLILLHKFWNYGSFSQSLNKRLLN